MLHGTQRCMLRIQEIRSRFAKRGAETRELTVTEHDHEQLGKVSVDFIMHTALTGAWPG
jgi:hypothetical protein